MIVLLQRMSQVLAQSGRGARSGESPLCVVKRTWASSVDFLLTFLGTPRKRYS